jgi:hypothetical protein
VSTALQLPSFLAFDFFANCLLDFLVVESSLHCIMAANYQDRSWLLHSKRRKVAEVDEYKEVTAWLRSTRYPGFMYRWCREYIMLPEPLERINDGDRVPRTQSVAKRKYNEERGWFEEFKSAGGAGHQGGGE